MSADKVSWESVTDLMAEKEHTVQLGPYIAYWFKKSPRRALHYLSYYKFAAKMIGTQKRVLDVGCNEGLGTWLLRKECGFVHGVDVEPDSIAVASSNWQEEHINFECGDFLTYQSDQRWDAIVSFDVVEHIIPDNMPIWWEKLTEHLTHDGIVVIGTPNIYSQKYASPITNVGHINLYTAERLEEQMREHFSFVFMFAANDEVVHTGFMPMAHYLLAVGCKKK